MVDKKIKDNKKLEIEKLRKEVEEYKNKYLRALADYQNLEKRVKEEQKEEKEIVKKELILRLLPFLDDLEKAEIFIKDDGLKMVKDRFYQILKEMGVEEIEILGKEFNPHLAEAIEVIEGEKDNLVAEVLRKGFKLNNKVIRIAQVKVTKKMIDKKETKKAKEELLKGDYM